jgi:hypothetical protein
MGAYEAWQSKRRGVSPAHGPGAHRRLRPMSDLTPRVSRAFALVGTLALTGVAVWLLADNFRLHRQSDRLAARLRQVEARGDSREEVQTRLAEDLAYTRATVSNLVRERSLGRALLEEHGGQVCLLHVAYRYVDARTGAPMTVARPGRGGTVILVHDVFGTGFPVGSHLLLSNRHVLEPWWQNPEAEAKGRQGFVPRTIAMRALCPAMPEPVPIELLDRSPDLDLATARVLQGEMTPVPVAPPEREVLSGFTVFLLGYPTGLDAALARAPEKRQEILFPLLRTAPGALADSLLQQGLIQPFLTHGRVSEVRPGQITFDAPTARGSSGGPLFNLRGEVIGVTTALLPGFSAANFAIPLDSSNSLLRER